MSDSIAPVSQSAIAHFTRSQQAPLAPPQPAPAETPDLPDAPPSLKEAQLAAAELLVLGTRDVEVARRLNVHRNTIARWRDDPEFQRCLQQRHRDLYQRVPVLLARGIEEALVLCTKLLQAPTDDRMAAAKLLLTAGVRGGAFDPPGRNQDDSFDCAE